jgi:hypothetical protein
MVTNIYLHYKIIFLRKIVLISNRQQLIYNITNTAKSYFTVFILDFSLLQLKE